MQSSMSEDLEDVLNEIGPFGPFQILLSIVVNLTDAAAAWGMLIMTLAGDTPDWWCPVSDGNPETNATTYRRANTSMTTTVLFSTSTAIENPDMKPNKTMAHEVQYCPEAGGFCPNITYSTEFTSIVSEWNLICHNSWGSGIILTIQMVGVLIGAAIAGQLGDLLGRKKTLFVLYISLLVTNFITAFSVSVEMYTTLRFFVGISTGGVLCTSSVLPVEYIGKRYRSFSNMVPMWSIGTIIMAGLAYFLRDWRNLAITVSGIGIPFLLFWWFIPESPRWLMARGRFDEAEDILHRIAKFNKKPELSKDHLKSWRKEVLRELEQRKTESKYTFLDLFRTWKYTKKTLLLFQVWFSCGLIYYGLSFDVKNWKGDRYVNLILNGLVDILSYLALAVTYKFGRRYTILMLLGLGAVSSLAIPVMAWTGYYESNSNAVSALALTAKLVVNGAWLVLMVFTAEQYPTVVRNLGVGVCHISSRLGGMVSPLLIEMHNMFPSVQYLVFGGLIVISSVCTMLLNETKDASLVDYLPPRKKKCLDECKQTIELKEQENQTLI